MLLVNKDLHNIIPMLSVYKLSRYNLHPFNDDMMMMMCDFYVILVLQS